MKRRLLVNVRGSAVTAAVLVLAFASTSSAHHSFAGYDMAKTLAGEATIREFRWGAPHSSGIFLIKDRAGKPQEIMLASSAPGLLVRQGFKPKDFKVGDKVQITWHPNRNGNPGGFLSSIKLPNGQTFKDMEAGESSFKDVPKAAAPEPK